MDVDGFIEEWESASPYVKVKTSGSTGTPKEMLVEKKRMLASARMTNDFLGLKKGDSALLCMSVDYIAGKMMVVRALERGLRFTSVPPSNHPFVGLNQPFDFVAMIPSQVHDSIDNPLLWQCRNIIIGGGAISMPLEEKILSKAKHRVFSTYGMTETLSHIAMRRIGERFYTTMPGVSLSQTDEGCLVIQAPEVCANALTTNDICELREDGTFRILGRKDNVICSGGIKIQAEEVERLLEPWLKAPFLITKTPDEKWGEAVVLLTEDSQPASLSRICKRVLPKYWVPKHYLHTDILPRTETGKPRRQPVTLV